MEKKLHVMDGEYVIYIDEGGIIENIYKVIDKENGVIKKCNVVYVDDTIIERSLTLNALRILYSRKKIKIQIKEE